jgi:hypothetical protein
VNLSDFDPVVDGDIERAHGARRLTNPEGVE